MEEQEKTPEIAREIKVFSRRTAMKIVAGLFAFVPAIKYLADSPDAFAYVPCTRPSAVSCSWQTVCADPNCTGRKTWWKFEYCIDLNTGDNCPSYQHPAINTGNRC